MIRFIYANELSQSPLLAHTMYKDRAAQFKHRLDWDVTVNEDGYELDQYDELNPLYVIWENANGTHGGSMRVMPTLGRIMTNEHFTHLTDGVTIASPLIWECTRFCLAPGANSKVAAALLVSGLELGLRFGLSQAIGVIYTKTLAIYRRIGWVPDVIGSDGDAKDSISIGVWEMCEKTQKEVCDRNGFTQEQVAEWFDRSFNAYVEEEQVAA